MNSFQLAARRTQALASRRFFSKGSIPTSSAAEVDGVKVVGLPHLSVSDMSDQKVKRASLLSTPFAALLIILSSTGLSPSSLQTSSMKWAYNQKHWLSDQGSYPLIAILAGTGCFVTGFIGYFTASSPDVQISPLKR